jgi:hypothetical protein
MVTDPIFRLISFTDDPKFPESHLTQPCLAEKEREKYEASLLLQQMLFVTIDRRSAQRF